MHPLLWKLISVRGMKMKMNVVVGLTFLILDGLLLCWLLFRDRQFYEKVVLGGEAAEQETKAAQTERKGRQIFQGMKFRAAVVIVCAVLAGAAGYQCAGATATVFEMIKLGAALLGVSAAMLVDFYVYIIPNRYLIYMCVSRAAILLAELLCGRPDLTNSLLNSMIGAVLSFGILLLLALVSRWGIGMGDVKLVTVMGLLCGFSATLNTLVYALIVCAISGVVLLIRKEKGLKDKIPFGPFIYCGYILTLVLGAV